LIDPAGEMWSVVSESPTFTRTRAPSMFPPTTASSSPSKNGGSCTYVDAGSQSYIGPTGDGSAAQCSSPSQIRPYSVSNCPRSVDVRIVSATSSGLGQMSASVTGPSTPSPIGSVVRSMSTRPAKAYATQSGGEPR
jgi:hypothetical protein